jgi:N-acetylmuramoyl-L-alanine amidase
MLTCLLEKNPCYLQATPLTPTRIVVHSTGANNPNLRRYVNPHDAQTTGMLEGEKSITRAEMLNLLGKNAYGNHWNRSGLDVCVHGFIGRLRDGTISYVQTLPYTMACWGVGAGKGVV